MANSKKITRTSLVVGYQQNGDDYEGGNCQHLVQGQRAFGRSVEMDSMGSESYLMCEACYKEATAERQTERVLCHDCKLSGPRGEMVPYIPYEEFGEHEYQRVKLHICKSCQTGETHLERLRNDKRLMDKDLEDIREDTHEGFW